MEGNQRIPLLMTASVSTRGMKGACFSDEERERMYLETLRYYLETLPEDQPIVFADNSGWNLSRFRKLADQFLKVKGQGEGEQRKVEFVEVDPAICDQTRGKGYNEILLMNAVVERSELIKQASAFMKVTGRYPIYNLPRFLKGAREWIAKGGKYYGDMKDHKVFDWIFKDTAKWNGHAAYTVLFATTVDFYREKLAESYRECNDYTNQWIEVVWYRILAPYRNGKGEPCRGGERVEGIEEKGEPCRGGERVEGIEEKGEPCRGGERVEVSGVRRGSERGVGNGVKLRLPVEPVCGGFQGSAAQTLLTSSSNDSLRTRLARFVGNCIRTFMPWFWF